MGLYGPRYQWIVPGWFSPDWIDVNDTECTPAQIRIALQYALTVTDLKEDLSENVTDSGQVRGICSRPFILPAKWPN